MNPGVSEEVGKVATGAIDALKNSPLVLALILLQLLTMGAVLYNSIHRQNAVSKQIGDMAEIIKSCIASKGEATNFRLQSEESVPLPLPRPAEPK